MTLDLDTIQARCNAATPGPWGYFDGDDYADIAADYQQTGRGSYTCRQGIARIEADSFFDDSAHEDADEDDAADQMRSNATFIAHARTDVPALIARVRELEADLTEMIHCRDNAIRALHRDDIDTDIDVEDTVANALWGPGWDWEDERTPRRIARDVAPEIRPALAKATQQRDAALVRVRELEQQLATTRAELERERAGKGHINLTRACTGCGHSRITHTSPEPHSCFAEGCGCSTFADPLDPSVAHDAR